MTREFQKTGDSPERLFTPGPLTTSAAVKRAMLCDLGSRDTQFLHVVQEIREGLLRVAGVGAGGYEAVLMQGSGTFSVESVLSSTVPPEGAVLAIVNGAYGARIAQIAAVLRIRVRRLEYPDNSRPDPSDVERVLSEHPGITHVAMVHCETSTGLINPAAEVGAVVRRHGKRYVVDAMSSFGGIPMAPAEWGIDYLVSSANKCIEGVPGFAFVLARREALLETRGWARSLSLDLFSQWQAMEQNGQFRFTPPVQCMLAFRRALEELEEEGGVAVRARRYRENHETLCAGMKELGFQTYLPERDQGPIITAFRYPACPSFRFEAFCERLKRRGLVIYPGKLSHAPCFRIGHIGRLFPEDMRALVAAIRQVAGEMGIDSLSAES